MGAIVKSSVRVAAAGVNSGNVSTGELPLIRGGQQVFSCLSGLNSGTILSCVSPRVGAIGVSGDILIFSGAGRLNSVMVFTPLASGVNVQIYDAAYAMSGGPFGGSGHNLLGVVQSVAWNPMISGILAPWNAGPVNVDAPFNSGLCVQARSGMSAFALSFTPETVPTPSGGALKG